ncbi:DNA repair ATPase [Mycoplasma crocodyli]|uniref:Possible DNA-repair ATPase n=1 Tax=Mycoplasma crocodyli (strain ATCC 51981 / MP145) TaxID=512564 RepID=D5E669_MYCCM|nr:DNA repair ATPase [Mycoplasma crocodyli]ADE19701.1 possible DNA-repair ATPase [Mycoplasma crocodyli MP145]
MKKILLIGSSLLATSALIASISATDATATNTDATPTNEAQKVSSFANNGKFEILKRSELRKTYIDKLKVELSKLITTLSNVEGANNIIARASELEKSETATLTELLKFYFENTINISNGFLDDSGKVKIFSNLSTDEQKKERWLNYFSFSSYYINNSNKTNDDQITSVDENFNFSILNEFVKFNLELEKLNLTNKKINGENYAQTLISELNGYRDFDKNWSNFITSLNTYDKNKKELYYLNIYSSFLYKQLFSGKIIYNDPELSIVSSSKIPSMYLVANNKQTINNLWNVAFYSYNLDEIKEKIKSLITLFESGEKQTWFFYEVLKSRLIKYVTLMGGLFNDRFNQDLEFKYMDFYFNKLLEESGKNDVHTKVHQLNMEFFFDKNNLDVFENLYTNEMLNNTNGIKEELSKVGQKFSENIVEGGDSGRNDELKRLLTRKIRNVVHQAEGKNALDQGYFKFYKDLSERLFSEWTINSFEVYTSEKYVTISNFFTNMGENDVYYFVKPILMDIFLPMANKREELIKLINSTEIEINVLDEKINELNVFYEKIMKYDNKFNGINPYTYLAADLLKKYTEIHINEIPVLKKIAKSIHNDEQFDKNDQDVIKYVNSWFKDGEKKLAEQGINEIEEVLKIWSKSKSDITSLTLEEINKLDNNKNDLASNKHVSHIIKPLLVKSSNKKQPKIDSFKKVAEILATSNSNNEDLSKLKNFNTSVEAEIASVLTNTGNLYSEEEKVKIQELLNKKATESKEKIDTVTTKLAEDFKAKFNTVTTENGNSINKDALDKLTEAKTEYDNLDPLVKEKLKEVSTTIEKNLETAKADKENFETNKLSNEEQIKSFKEKYQTLVDKTNDVLSINDLETVEAALKEFESKTQEVKTALAEQKQKLDAQKQYLLDKKDAEAKKVQNDEQIKLFKQTHDQLLNKADNTLDYNDLTSIEAALKDLDSKNPEVQTALSSEKQKLESKKQYLIDKKAIEEGDAKDKELKKQAYDKAQTDIDSIYASIKDSIGKNNKDNEALLTDLKESYKTFIDNKGGVETHDKYLADKAEVNKKLINSIVNDHAINHKNIDMNTFDFLKANMSDEEYQELSKVVDNYNNFNDKVNSLDKENKKLTLKDSKELDPSLKVLNESPSSNEQLKNLISDRLSKLKPDSKLKTAMLILGIVLSGLAMLLIVALITKKARA